MVKRIIEKTAVTAVLVLYWLLGVQTGYQNGYADGTPVGTVMEEHVLAMVSHAGAWHLAGNLFVLWLIAGRLHLLPSLAIAFLMSFVPAFGIVWPMSGVTMGFSGVLFAIIGIKWGIYCRSFDPAGTAFVRRAVREFCVKVLPFALIGIFIPQVNWCVHLYCVLTGFAYGYRKDGH